MPKRALEQRLLEQDMISNCYTDTKVDHFLHIAHEPAVVRNVGRGWCEAAHLLCNVMRIAFLVENVNLYQAVTLVRIAPYSVGNLFS